MRQQITIDGRPLSYLEAGRGATLVLIHAFPLSADMWEPQLNAVPAGWRFIAPDLRGFGYSTAESSDQAGSADQAATSIDDYAEDVEALLERLGITHAVIGGLSMGGYITLAMFRRAPEVFRGLVLADTRAGADTDEGRTNRIRMQVLVDREGPSGVATQMLPKLLGEETRRRNPELIQRVRRLIESNDSAAIKAALESMMARPDSTPVLADIRCPALVIVGEQDELTPVREAETLHRHIAGSACVVIPSAGHLASLERPTEFNEALADFLRRTFS